MLIWLANLKFCARLTFSSIEIVLIRLALFPNFEYNPIFFVSHISKFFKDLWTCIFYEGELCTVIPWRSIIHRGSHIWVSDHLIFLAINKINKWLKRFDDYGLVIVCFCMVSRKLMKYACFSGFFCGIFFQIPLSPIGDKRRAEPGTEARGPASVPEEFFKSPLGFGGPPTKSICSLKLHLSIGYFFDFLGQK